MKGKLSRGKHRDKRRGTKGRREGKIKPSPLPFVFVLDNYLLVSFLKR
jgi:hypothetical protein